MASEQQTVSCNGETRGGPGEGDRIRLSVVTTSDPRAGRLPRLLAALEALSRQPGGPVLDVVIVDDLKQWPDPGTADRFARTQTGDRMSVEMLWYPEHRGQLQALLAGIRTASGDAVITLDPDQVACVAELPSMMERWRNGCLLVHGRRAPGRRLGPIRSAGTALANILARSISGLSVHDFGSPVTLLDAGLVASLLELPPGVTHPRLYLYLCYRDRLCEYTLPATDDSRTPSHYSLLSLAAVFLDLLVQSFVVRRAVARRNRRAARIER